jgi:Ni/Fe-hydrogenase subunit HybB-like protein
MSAHDRAEPVGGPLLTTPVRVLLLLFGMSMLLILWRFAVGLGPSTAMNDGYPFGLWIAFDVVTGTALACGGYAVAILVYIFNHGKYHPLIRPAILTSALGYSIGAFSVIIDVGRPWHIWKVPLFFWEWNVNSALLEVALCIMAYVFVLWIELSPAFLERWRESHHPKLARFAGVTHDFLEKALIWIIALGLLLPTMHQSSLGSVMLLAGPKLHGLWNTGLLPLLFLLGCVTMGYGVVVMESALASSVFKRKPETPMLRSLFGAAVAIIWVILFLRFMDLFMQGRLWMAMSLDFNALLFWTENLLLVAPALMFRLAGEKRRRNLGFAFRAAFLLVGAGAAYRFNTYLVAFNPGDHWLYFPAVPELLITFGLIAFEILLYIVIVKRFPILGGVVRPRPPDPRPVRTPKPQQDLPPIVPLPDPAFRPSTVAN